MRKFIFILCLLIALPVFAQEEQQSPYNIALQRIEEARLSGVPELDLSGLGLIALPPEIGELRNLEFLYLGNNNLNNLPVEIGKLENLWGLYLSNNLLTTLPHEIIGLTRLCYLDLSNNLFQQLPVELGHLPGLTGTGVCYSDELSNDLVVTGNVLISPPPEVIAQGTPAIFEYLRNEIWWHTQKLIAGGASFAGILATVVLGIRWRNHRRKGKKRGV